LNGAWAIFRAASMRSLFGAAALAAAAVLVSVTSAQAVTGLQPVPSPNVAGSDYNELDGVAALGPSNAWAVGFTRPAGTLIFHTLAEHWDGAKWSIVPTASVPAADDTRLHAITFRSATDGWAVGEDSTVSSTGETAQSLIEHWNGTSWSRVPSPAGEPAGTVLKSVSAVAANDVWAVGNGIIEHWNGTAWSIIPGAAIATGGVPRLLGVTAISGNDVWAVGATPNRHPTPFVEHWNGTSWSQVTQPVGGFDSELSSVSAVSSTDVWAVGQQNLNQTVTEHWDGKSWAQVPSPSVTTGNAQDTLNGVVALSSGDVWAVGQTLQSFSTNQTLALHWDGSTWQIVPSGNSGTGSNTLNGVTGTGPGQPLWAVGTFITGSNYDTLVETTTG
jgi:hypothetical protein